jgi:hypothetical protein
LILIKGVALAIQNQKVDRWVLIVISAIPTLHTTMARTPKNSNYTDFDERLHYAATMEQQFSSFAAEIRDIRTETVYHSIVDIRTEPVYLITN